MNKGKRVTIPHGEHGSRDFYIRPRSPEEMNDTPNSPRPTDEELRKSIVAASGDVEADDLEPTEETKESPPEVNEVAAPVPPPPATASTPPSTPVLPPGVSVVDVSNVASVVSPQAHQQAAKQVVINDSHGYDVAFNMAFLGA